MRPYFFDSTMRSIFFLLTSVIIHALLITGLKLSVNASPRQFDNAKQVLQVKFEQHVMPKKPDLIQDKKTFTHIPQTHRLNTFKEPKNTNQLTENTYFPSISTDVSVPNIVENPIQSSDDMLVTTEELSNFYATADLDRKALPQINIDESQIQSDTYSGLPIKLRLYINSLGKLVKVEPIAVMEQDKEYAAQLAELLAQLVFLPAKKDSLDVNSYQDLEFSFSSLPIKSEQSDLNK